MGFISDYMMVAMQTADVEVRYRYTLKNTYTWKNTVRPSALTVKTPKVQVKYLFHPHLLAAIGYFNDLEAEDMINKRAMDVPGTLNCGIGTILHQIYLPELEKTLISHGISAKHEHPLISKKYGIEGQADLVVFDHDSKKMCLVDLKTTGAAILKRNTEVSDDYQRQLTAYGLALEECYPDYTLEECIILSLCKIPGSKVYTEVQSNTEDESEPQLVKCKTPLLAEWSSDWATLKKKYIRYFEELYKLVVEFNLKIKEAVPGYDHWIINNDLYLEKLNKMEEEYSNGQN